MNLSGFDGILQGMQQDRDGWVADCTGNWMQGRTLYGGLTAAIALQACQLMVPDLPLLRAGQIAFIGPAGANLRAVPSILRQGKSVTYMGCDVFSDDQLVLRALYAFGAERTSRYQVRAPRAPECRPPEDCPSLGGDKKANFMHNIEQRVAGDLMPLAGADRGDLLVWARHVTDVSPGMAPLVTLGDALPPASYTRLTEPAPLSSMTWGFEFMQPELVTGVGWHLMRSVDDGVEHGYAGQSMYMWDADGNAILMGRQAVAIFC